MAFAILKITVVSEPFSGLVKTQCFVDIPWL